MAEFPQVRMRRLRRNETIRNMLAEPLPGPEKFIWPVFVVEGRGVKQPIDAMPGQFRYSVDMLAAAVAAVFAMGIKAIMLFGVVEDTRKSPDAAYALLPDGVVPRAARTLKTAFPELLIFTDVCVCEYTSHGHCGIITADGNVKNDQSLELLARMAVRHAEAGADAVAPSAMMDGQTGAIRAALDAAGFPETLIMSYSTKFASAMYGPFRDAAGSAPATGDRQGYQADFRNQRAALRESLEDEAEGADILMVKPALFYLDMILRIRENSNLPLAAYNVSGEYSMLLAAADRGWGNLKAMVRESVFAQSRAGADIFISYWANQYDTLLKD